MGPRTDSSCCCQARNLSWAPVPPPHAAAPKCVMGPCTASHCCCLHRHHTLPCATFRSPHTAVVVSIFVIGCCMASHCCCLHRHSCGSTLWFWPRDCPNE
ncbi:unnamed protein product [Staurois parvus]|uniref:Uncharacterized protein n=1 Tax=Staurois parvus TaxID=386267 RepID=A0ABN9C3D9_9NEOB|nr:unnamed protein product [Staurois parvus]